MTSMRGRGSGAHDVGVPTDAHRRRPTLGVLAGWHVYDTESLNPFLGAVLEGIATAAAEHDCNVLIAAGSEHPSSDAPVQAAWPFRDGGYQFAPVGHFNTDALMVVLPVRSESARRYVRDLRATGFPVTFLGVEPEASYVAIDNRAGVFAAFRHLVAHGHERIAFVAGDPADLGDTPRRLQAFRDAATEAGLAVDDRLVDYGMHNRLGGHAAAARILARGAPFTALMASNDQSAIGAVDAFHLARVRVPEDVAVVGFDDQPSAAAHVPSLTSVAYPVRDAAHTLLELTLRRVRAPDAPSEHISIAPKLVARLSCGCVPGTSPEVGEAQPPPAPRSIDQIAVDVLQRLRANGRGTWHGEEPESAVRACIASFLRVLAAGEDHGTFIASLVPILRYVERVDAHANGCQLMVTELRHEMIARIGEAEGVRRQLAEDLLHETRLVFSEAVHRQDRRHRVEADHLSNAIGRTTAQILASTTEEQIQAVLRRNLGDVGVGEASLLTMVKEAPAEATAGPDEIAAAAQRAFPGFGASLRGRRHRYHLALVPLVFGGEQLGCALFDATRMGPLGTIARQVGAGLRSARLHAEVLRLSLTDKLTGLKNRAYLDLVLGDAIERCVRYTRPLCVLMLDIDRFKRYNDTHGHVAGDDALVAVAEAARSVARDADVLARYGGEEFVMVMAETDLDGGYRLAERIRHAVRDLDGLRSQLTVSIGVAALSPTPSNETAHALLERADQALYRAKRTGRDRVCAARTHPPSEPSGAEPAGPLD